MDKAIEITLWITFIFAVGFLILNFTNNVDFQEISESTEKQFTGEYDENILKLNLNDTIKESIKLWNSCSFGKIPLDKIIYFNDSNELNLTSYFNYIKNNKLCSIIKSSSMNCGLGDDVFIESGIVDNKIIKLECDPINEKLVIRKDGSETVTSQNLCPNGNIDPGEECDSNNLGSNTCLSLGGFNGGILSCDNSCNFNISDCFNCGDGNVDFGEECDGSVNPSITCQSLGFLSGSISCGNSCNVNTSSCTYADSCLDLKNQGISLSGTYTIDPGQIGDPFKIYCDFDMQDGPWTLVFNSDQYFGSYYQFGDETCSGENENCVTKAYSKIPIGDSLILDGNLNDMISTTIPHSRYKIPMTINRDKIVGKTFREIMLGNDEYIYTYVNRMNTYEIIPIPNSYDQKFKDYRLTLKHSLTGQDMSLAINSYSKGDIDLNIKSKVNFICGTYPVKDPNNLPCGWPNPEPQDRNLNFCYQYSGDIGGLWSNPLIYYPNMRVWTN